MKKNRSYWLNKWFFALSIVFTSQGLNFADLPPDFKVETIATGIKQPTCLVHLPDGRIFVNERGGNIFAVDPLTKKPPSLVYGFPVSGGAEQGLLKMVIDPHFAENGWLYVYYATPDNDHHNIDRLTIGKDNSVSGVINITKLPQITGGRLHNGSAMAFGKDGNLYVGRGEDQTNTWAPLWTSQRGKILRFTPDGKPAPGNPHYNVVGASDEEKSIWARGFRNPWTLTYDPASGRLFEGDVGNLHEEINDLTAPDSSKDFWYGYGPNYPPGDGSDPTKLGNTIDPLYYYNTGSIGCAVLGELPLTSAATKWPEEYKNRIYFADFCSGWIRSLPMKPAGKGVDVNDTVTSKMKIFGDKAFFNPLGLSQGVDGNMYLVGYGSGQVLKISYTGVVGIEKPFASLKANGQSTFLKIAIAADLTFNVTGLTNNDNLLASFVIHDMQGKEIFQQSATLQHGELALKNVQINHGGLVFYQISWNEAGQIHHTQGHLMVLP